MKCKKCACAGAYVRIRTNDIFCRLCGHSEPLKAEQPINAGVPVHTEKKKTS